MVTFSTELIQATPERPVKQVSLLPHLACPPKQLVGARARLRRLAEALKELFGPDEPAAFPTLLGHYHVESSPVKMLALLDYIDQLERERHQAQKKYAQHIQALLREWREDCILKPCPVFFDLKSRELTGQPLPQRPALLSTYFVAGRRLATTIPHANPRYAIRHAPAAGAA